jgi:hypothetical protein
VRTRLVFGGLSVQLAVVLVSWLSGSLQPDRAQAQQEKELSPVERIGRMKADDPGVPARIDQAMHDLQAKARDLRKNLEDIQRQLVQLEEMRRNIARRQQPARNARPAGDKLDQILLRLERIERRLDRLEAKVAETAPQRR